MSIELKSHLKEVEDLYKKISDFEAAVNLNHTYDPVKGAHHYIEEDIDNVIDAFSKSLDFNGEAAGLRDAMLSGDVDFMGLISAKNSVPDEEFQLLYIISRPFFKSMKGAVHIDDMFWQDGKCPVCSAVPSLSVIEKETQRKYLCSYCGTAGSYLRIGCPGCLTDDPRDITLITLEGEEGMRADTCEKCGSYVKTFEGSMMDDYSIDTLDIMSIPLDIIVQEKGFKRNSPNPVGVINVCK